MTRWFFRLVWLVVVLCSCASPDGEAISTMRLAYDEEPPEPPAAAPALTPETDITGALDCSWGAFGLGVASGGCAGAFGPNGLAGDVPRHAASTVEVPAGLYRMTGVIGIRSACAPPARAWSGLVGVVEAP